MAQIHAVRRNTASANTADGTAPEALDASRYGELFMGPDWRQRAIMAGKGFQVTVGAFSTPITGGGAGTVLDQDQPELVLSVPSGYMLVPLRISVQCQVPLLATDADEAEILVAVDRAAASNASGSTGTAETVFNLRTDLTTGSMVTAVSANTSNITNPTLGIELARAVVTGDVQGTAATALWTPLDLVYEPSNPPFIVGPAALYLYWGGTVATTGFAQVTWVELPVGYAN